ncbi:hypothetical protein O987_12350 [Comamonas testosteroni TK102]|uniref:Uncharacterized protein n=1 Tax=Comamonas testosteroni TK102 TaxID=1392005 RepID=A0A076PIJ7_COMTE|nr:hypothetical protein O987_12350 [Comamonas testosteroni TK102]
MDRKRAWLWVVNHRILKSLGIIFFPTVLQILCLGWGPYSVREIIVLVIYHWGFTSQLKNLFLMQASQLTVAVFPKQQEHGISTTHPVQGERFGNTEEKIERQTNGYMVLSPTLKQLKRVFLVVL